MRFVQVIACILCLSVLITLFAAHVSAEDLLYGDANADGEVSSVDALIVLQHTVSKVNLVGDQAIAADVSGTDGIYAGDALLILRYVVGKITSFPAEEAAVLNQNLQVVPQLLNTKSYATAVAPVNSNLSFHTLTQINQAYSPLYDLDIACVLAYVYGFNHGAQPSDWVENKTSYGDNDTIGIMIAVNRDNGEYLKLYPERGMKDVQNFLLMQDIHMLENLYSQHFLVLIKMPLTKVLRQCRRDSLRFGRFHIFQLTQWILVENMSQLLELTVNPVRVA